MGLKTCANCGVQRESYSARSAFYCSATACQNAARPRKAIHGLCHAVRKPYFKRQRAVRKRLRKQGAIV